MSLTIRDLYEECVLRERSLMGCCILYLLRNNLAKPDNDIDSVDFNLADKDQVLKMVEENVLGVKEVKLFSLKVDDFLYAFVFAKNEEEARAFTINKLKKKPRNCHEYWMDQIMKRGLRTLSFRDMKYECSSFPTLAGYYEKEEAYR